MKLFSLNKKSSIAPCMILKLKDLTIMLDTKLDLTPILDYLPVGVVERKQNLKHWLPNAEIKRLLGTEANIYEIGGRVFLDSLPEAAIPEKGMVDFASIDVILVTSYNNILALPYITEYSGFNGKVLATEPTLQIGKLLMEELVTYNKNMQKRKKFSLWKQKDIQRLLPSPLCEYKDAISWETVYSSHDVSSCISNIQSVGFSEKIDILGLMQVTPVSSGLSIGSTNWILETDFHKIVYISNSSLFATHSMAMHQTSLKDADVCILNSLTQTHTLNPDAMLRDFCNNLATTLKSGGNVLVPCIPSGVIYDLFEYVCNFMDGSGLSFIPVYFVSPVAHSSLAHANIYGEWLNQNKQAKMYLPEPPFLHHELVKNGRIKHFSTVHDRLSNNFKSPCVVFTGHPSLRFGDVIHFMELWGGNHKNTIIFIDSEFNHIDALIPFQPLTMKAVFCPIDPRLNYHQANKLIKDITPKHLIIPEEYTTPPVMTPQRTDFVIFSDCPLQSYKGLDVLNISLKKDYSKIALSPELSQKLNPKQIEPGVALAMVKGKIVTRNNRHILKPYDGRKSPEKEKTDRLYGNVDVEQFVAALRDQGIRNAEFEETESGHIVHFPDKDAMIQLEPGNTHIINHVDEKLRVKIKNALLSCLLIV
ncbi:integrator complex subunit 9 homolog [Clytia hemisphaerica]|uniref:Beta-Casp domain-containing protein n=1 Tax=Clytia hemisphaerica TaxID=252671 RepID=A0A7M5V3T8_9CNID